MNDLLEAYSGNRATGYDARRARSRRWREEIAAMTDFLDRLKPKTVLDCPFGTGRWIPQFEKIGARVIGIDLSEDMLEEARAKIATLPDEAQARYDLRCASIFDIAPEKGEPVPDVVACIRFVNWVSFEDVDRALAALTRFGSPNAILGASVVPVNTNPFRRIWYKLSQAAIGWRGKGRPKQYVHEERDLLDLLGRHGWKVIDKRLVMRRNARRNFFYLLERI